MILITIVTGVYKPIYNWGPHIVGKHSQIVVQWFAKSWGVPPDHPFYVGIFHEIDHLALGVSKFMKTSKY